MNLFVFHSCSQGSPYLIKFTQPISITKGKHFFNIPWPLATMVNTYMVKRNNI